MPRKLKKAKVLCRAVCEMQFPYSMALMLCDSAIVSSSEVSTVQTCLHEG